jgi:hypothetical protein
MINGKCDYKPICNRFTEYYDQATNTCIAYTCCKDYSQKLCTPCYKTCPNGSQIDIRDGECPVTCERKACNELQEWDEENCTCHTNKIRCEDGSIIAFGERCPQKSSDGSYVPWGESCPVVCKKKTCSELQSWNQSDCKCVTDKKKCDDGSIVSLNATCPTVCKKKTCTELQSWNESSCSCVTDKRKCEDGSIVALNATCPEVCVIKRCGKSQIFNEETCKCEAPICDEGYVFNSHTGQCDPTSGSPDDCSTLKGVARDICFCRAEGGIWVYPGTPGYADYLGNSCVVRSNR